MELMIKIPDKVYNRIKSDNGHGYCTLRDQDEHVIVNAICNSIRLAKGHGDLVDRDKLQVCGGVIYPPAVIPADKESDNEIDN